MFRGVITSCNLFTLASALSRAKSRLSLVCVCVCDRRGSREREPPQTEESNRFGRFCLKEGVSLKEQPPQDVRSPSDQRSRISYESPTEDFEPTHRFPLPHRDYEESMARVEILLRVRFTRSSSSK